MSQRYAVCFFPFFKARAYNFLNKYFFWLFYFGFYEILRINKSHKLFISIISRLNFDIQVYFNSSQSQWFKRMALIVLNNERGLDDDSCARKLTCILKVNSQLYSHHVQSFQVESNDTQNIKSKKLCYSFHL